MRLTRQFPACCPDLAGLTEIPKSPSFPIYISPCLKNTGVGLSYCGMKRYLIPTIVCIALSALVFCLMFFLRDNADAYAKASDGFFVAGACILAYFLMTLVVRSGTFDVFGYSFQRFFEAYRHKGMEKRYEDAGDYHVQKVEKRRTNKLVWVPYLVVGLIDIALAIGFLIAFQSQIAA